MKRFSMLAAMIAIGGLGGLVTTAPEGVLYGTAQAAEARPIFRLCTGNDQKTYYKAGQEVRKVGMTPAINVDIQVVPTDGSINNLEKLLNGECDGVFAQSDATLVLSSSKPQIISAVERAGNLYNEEVILACNRKANISSMGDLKPDTTIAVSGGSRVTFDAFKSKVKNFKGQPVDLAGERAIGAVSDGSEVQCLFDVSARGSAFIKTNLSSVGDQVVLVSTYDKSVGNDIKDTRGRAIYESSELPGGTYPRLQPKGWTGSSKSVDIMVVPALFLGSTRYIQDSPANYDKVLRAFRDAKGPITRLITPKN